MASRRSVIRAWRPSLPGVAEVFHARFVDHAYPMHTHDTWDLMVLDHGAVRFALDRHDHGNAEQARVILLPPGVPHDGRTVNTAGFRKRVLYLDDTLLPRELVGAAVDTPMHADHLLRDRLSALHDCLSWGESGLEAETRLAFIRERLLARLGSAPEPRASQSGWSSHRLADELRQLLDAHVETGLTLAQAAETLGASSTHLVRTFSRTFGLPPHRYLTGLRIDRARRLLLSGASVADAAASAGFHDQSHLHRHFVRFLGTTPGDYVDRTMRPAASVARRAERGRRLAGDAASLCDVGTPHDGL